MPRYSVIITRDITESTTVVVSAAGVRDAEEKALKALSLQEDTQWEVDDGSWNSADPYVTDVSEAQ